MTFYENYLEDYQVMGHLEIKTLVRCELNLLPIKLILLQDNLRHRFKTSQNVFIYANLLS